MGEPCWVYGPDSITPTTTDRVEDLKLRMIRRGIPEEAIIVVEQQVLWEDDHQAY
jgi:hypothetical protein